MREGMMQSLFRSGIIVALAILFPALALAQTSDAPRTPWGDPDLGGVWDYWTFTPLERPEDLADRDTLTVEEAAAVAQEANEAAWPGIWPRPPGIPARTARPSGRTEPARRR